MKKTYNVFADTKGVRNWGEDVLAEMFEGDDIEIIETPTCFLKVRKEALSCESYVEHIRAHFAGYRVHPSTRYPNRVQWSTKRGKWVNGPVLSSAEEAKSFVRENNERLIPFANSPYLVYDLAEVIDYD